MAAPPVSENEISVKAVMIFLIVAAALVGGFFAVKEVMKSSLVAASSDLESELPVNELHAENIGIRKGNIAPEFSVKTTDDREMKLSGLKAEKKPVLLYFMATWCPYCHEDFESAKNIYPKYKDTVEFVAVSLDLSEDAKKLQSYREKNGYSWDFAPGNSRILSDYAVTSTTRKYAIGTDGVILYFSAGPIDERTWEIVFKGLEES